MMVIGAYLWSEVCCPRPAVPSDRFNRWAMTAPVPACCSCINTNSFPMALTVSITTLLALGLRCLCFGQAAAYNTAAPEFNTIASSTSIKDVWMSRVTFVLSGIALVAICELSVRLFPGDVPLAILALPLTMGWLMIARSQVMQRAFGAVMTPLALLTIAGFPVMFHRWLT